MASAGEVGDRVERLLAEFEALADPTLAARAEELVRTVVEFYGTALERIVELTPEPALERLAADQIVAGVLVVHDLHPHSLEQRVQRALDGVRPYLGSHSGDVSFVEITDEGVLRLALGGSCDGCPSSTVTVKLAIEQAIEHAAPEIVRIDVEGVVPLETGPGGRPLLPLVTAEKASWVELGEADMVAPGAVSSARVRDAATVVCNAGGTLYAYRDRCAACQEALSGGHFDGRLLSCPSCGASYDVVAAGRAVNGNGHLDPLPLLASDDGTIRVAVST
ncbi:NifU family protein [Kutzneria sp. 744]|uniref:NifU family protein n=1 Tax=Kutzneria sp. (strain 744) TaxID=345341 RepID=UPI0003EED57B|nr:NifU family protein [Kutzneria sp. 744]EWM09743.1 iron-sulfur cluster-binding protein, Rieske family [Kutzneria sp. 744]